MIAWSRSGLAAVAAIAALGLGVTGCGGGSDATSTAALAGGAPAIGPDSSAG